MENQAGQVISDPRKRLQELLSDIKVLLGYLGQLCDPVLQAHFEDTRKNVTDVVRLRSTPPCRTYHHFLSRLAIIGLAVVQGKTIEEIQNLPASITRTDGASPSPEGDETQDSISFLYWSRDFLASVAAPATIETIAITQAYIEERTRGPRSWPIGRWFNRDANRQEREELRTLDLRQVVAVNLSTRVRYLQRWALGMVAVTLLTSIFALSGRLALQQQHDAVAAFTKSNAMVQAYLHDHRDILTTFHDQLGDLTSDTDEVRAVCMGQTPTAHGDNLGIREASFVPVPLPSRTLSSQTTVIVVPGCGEFGREFRRMFSVTLHLQSWNSIVTRGPSIHIPWTTVSLKVPELFGVVPLTINQLANDMTETSCREIGGPFAARLKQETDCARIFYNMIEISEDVASSILGALTLYLLPCLYAYIGAVAATMRMLRRKIDAYQLSFTDRGRIGQNLVLGVMCGAMIGLFAGYLLHADAAQGLGLSALALLAGYNVSGVFGFIDELSDRVFRPANGTAPAKV